MNYLEIQDKIRKINYQKSEFDKFSTKGFSLLDKIHREFSLDQINISTSLINNNTFAFSFWGLSITIRPEVIFDAKSGRFKQGELNSYIKEEKEEDEILLLSYTFDTIGNINNEYLLEDFSLYYYSDLVSKIIEYSEANAIKFKL